MFRRILLDPTAETAGTGEVTPVTAGKAPETPATMTLSASEVEGLRSRLAAYEKAEADQKAAAESKERERLAAVAAKGEAQKAVADLEGRYKKDVTEREERYNALRARWEGRERSTAVAKATTGVQWASEFAGRDAMERLEGRLEVVEADDQVLVRDRVTGRPAADVVKELLASPEFAHYQAPSAKGKGGTGGGNTAAPTGGQGEAQPDNLFTRLNAARGVSPGEFKGYGFGGKR